MKLNEPSGAGGMTTKLVLTFTTVMSVALTFNTMPSLPQLPLTGIDPDCRGPLKLQLAPMVPPADALATVAGNVS